MAQDPEKRFESIMEKLFHTPKSSLVSSSSTEAQTSIGKKRPNPSYALALVDAEKKTESLDGSHPSAMVEASQTPLCRPWDRGDLMRRLRTFKAMTWFAKPKVISPINCARRGWINVEMDTIACESCGARHLFTTPPSWTQQQVEKAASVFGLKLDNGHKSICPWINNVCDEALAEFPPTTPVDLTHKCKERSSALLELDALPVISSSVIGYLKSPELEVFLKEPLLLQENNGVAEFMQPEFIRNRSEAESADLYFQAYKLISLCGWEPRALPYVIDWKNESDQSDKDSGFTSSVVLDCKLCGASAGLWTFSMVPQPVELLKFVGETEVNAGDGIDDTSAVRNSASLSGTPSKENFSGLKMTIAGGPPPTKQNFKAKISLPVIGRNLRAKLFHDSVHKANVVDNPVENQCSTESNHSTSMEVSVIVRDDSFRNESLSSLDGTRINEEGTSDIIVHDTAVEGPVDSAQNYLHGSEDKRLAENVENGEPENVGANGSCGVQVRQSLDKLLVWSTGKELKPLTLDGKMQFDPIRQHRQFCPWVASSSNKAPGWKQTLFALLRGKQLPSSPQSAPSTSVIKVDDPLLSVRRLFMSSSAEREKTRH